MEEKIVAIDPGMLDDIDQKTLNIYLDQLKQEISKYNKTAVVTLEELDKLEPLLRSKNLLDDKISKKLEEIQDML